MLATRYTNIKCTRREMFSCYQPYPPLHHWGRKITWQFSALYRTSFSLKPVALMAHSGTNKRDKLGAKVSQSRNVENVNNQLPPSIPCVQIIKESFWKGWEEKGSQLKFKRVKDMAATLIIGIIFAVASDLLHDRISTFMMPS